MYLSFFLMHLLFSRLRLLNQLFFIATHCNRTLVFTLLTLCWDVDGCDGGFGVGVKCLSVLNIKLNVAVIKCDYISSLMLFILNKSIYVLTNTQILLSRYSAFFKSLKCLLKCSYFTQIWKAKKYYWSAVTKVNHGTDWPVWCQNLHTSQHVNDQ